MTSARYRIEVFHRFHDPRCEVVRKKLSGLGYSVRSVHMADAYLVDADITPEQAERVADLLVQPVIEDRLINTPCSPPGFDYAVEIGYLPGVTDNIAHTVRESIEDLLKMKLDIEKSVFSATTYFFAGDLRPGDVECLSMELHNPLIQRKKILSAGDFARQGGMGKDIPVVSIHERPEADVVDLSVDDRELMLIGKEGIRDADGTRRGPLALDMLSMNVIRDYFLGTEKRNPTDIELESIAQTWSEHCKHTIFSAELDDDIPEGIFKTYIREATVRVRREKGDRDFCVSVFTDNSGGIDFDENYIVSDKVETHNSPSALDPFGGAITGIVGVNRDAIGFGMAAKPVANRYGFCFADPFDRKPLYKSKDPASAMLSPRRIMEGVVHGVNAGGNTSGIPTPQGFLYFDERYKGKPLVFVGTIGLLPKTVNGRPSSYKKAMPGDAIVVIGGRVGRDGIHGATFSSEALTSGSPATAVQIGDPITQKKLSDAIVKEARDRGLYDSITDNGAGGLSCSVAEMARECGGFEVDLDRVPLKYPGLGPLADLALGVAGADDRVGPPGEAGRVHRPHEAARRGVGRDRDLHRRLPRHRALRGQGHFRRGHDLPARGTPPQEAGLLVHKKEAPGTGVFRARRPDGRVRGHDRPAQHRVLRVRVHAVRPRGAGEFRDQAAAGQGEGERQRVRHQAAA